MRIFMKNLASLLAVGMLAACAGSAGPAKKAPAVAPATPAIATLGGDEILARLGGLPPQRLDAKTCGMFLWLKRDDAPLVFFQRSDGAASMVVDGKVLQVQRRAVERPIGLAFFESQTFEAADMTITVAVQPESLRTLQQGLKLPAGSLSVKAPGGWSAVLPVAGAIGCQ